ncbi:response regulator [Paenibacillus filicis]|uniref:Response regulator n=1 Tax=Paenibacillus gyeongsangnamensis TaxID=3388067 RepID=A0ABT4QKG8_9BACL|nr:response regulator [Paenibacillus filicis]MCZ8517368.1 response regulator [Paenibacillus filicis]
MNIFLVEDEYWALAELKELFRVYEPEHRVFAFDNGEDALLAADTVRPDLVLTDINMPGMDGLELVQKLNERDASIMKMIISVHDHFEYARQGMKFGVADFLVKPVKKDIMLKTVDQALQQIKRQMTQTEERLHASLVQALLTPEFPTGPKLERFYKDPFCMLLLQLEGAAYIGWKDTGLRLADLKKLPSNPSQGEILGVELDGRQRVLLFECDPDEGHDMMEVIVEQLFERIRSDIYHIHIGMTKKSARQSLYEAFGLLKQHLEDRMLFGMPTLALQQGNRDVELGDAWDRVRLLETHYRKGELVKGEAALHNMLKELRNKKITRRQLRLFVSDMLFSLKYKLLSSRSGSVILHDLHEDPRLLQHVSGYGELLHYLHEKIVRLYGEEEPADRNPKGLIPVLLRLIHSRYQETISLQRFAAEHHVSLGYLSRMFKAQTGLTFSEYLAEYRIRKAKELLSGGVERLQEVSRMVGYEDPKHFSAIFKKLVGETPMTYAKRAMNK